MLKSISGENDQMSSSSTNSRNVLKIAATQRFTPSAKYSRCSTAGSASTTAPTSADHGPKSSDSSTVPSNERSAARKFGTRTRTSTPSVSGTQIHATSAIVSARVRSAPSSSRRAKLHQQRNQDQVVARVHAFTLRASGSGTGFAASSPKAARRDRSPGS